MVQVFDCRFSFPVVRNFLLQIQISGRPALFWITDTDFDSSGMSSVMISVRMVSFLALSIRGALSILDARFKFARASYLVSGEPWSTVRMEQRTFGRILCLLRSDWSLQWLDVCICTDVSERASRSRFVKDVASWFRRWVVSQSGQGSREVPGPSVPGRVRSGSIAPDVVLEYSSSDEDRLPEGRVARTSQGSLQLLDPSEWRLAAYGGFLPRGKQQSS